MLEINTFGNTPAAHYLVRLINEREPKAVRPCTIRCKTFNENVNEIIDSVNCRSMTPHVAANLLRLLRQEATTIEFDSSLNDHKFISQLLSNVIIGNIKQAIKRIATLRKLDIKGETLNKAKTFGKELAIDKNEVRYTSKDGYPIGLLIDDRYFKCLPRVEEIKDTTTSELLYERSNRRCLRQNKPHMIKEIL